MIIDGMINKKLKQAKAKISGKIAEKVTGVLDKVLNGKVKGALNEKLAKAGGNEEPPKMREGGGSEDKWLPKVNGILSSRLGKINGNLEHMLKSKDPMPLEVKKGGKVEMKQLFDISSLHIDSFQAVAITLPTATFELKAHWGAPLKLAGDVQSNWGAPKQFDVLLQNASFATSHIVAT